MTVDSYDYDANCRHWPDVVGPFSVGTLEFEVTDTLRNSQYAPEPTVIRRLYVRAWYPAGDVADCPRRPYFTTAEVGTVPVMSLQLLRQPPDALRNAARLLTNAWVGAPPAAGKFPVIGFNHGYLSYPAQHTALFEHLAANGYGAQCGPPVGEWWNRLSEGAARPRLARRRLLHVRPARGECNSSRCPGVDDHR